MPNKSKTVNFIRIILAFPLAIIAILIVSLVGLILGEDLIISEVK